MEWDGATKAKFRLLNDAWRGRGWLFSAHNQIPLSWLKRHSKHQWQSWDNRSTWSTYWEIDRRRLSSVIWCFIFLKFINFLTQRIDNKPTVVSMAVTDTDNRLKHNIKLLCFCCSSCFHSHLSWKVLCCWQRYRCHVVSAITPCNVQPCALSKNSIKSLFHSPAKGEPASNDLLTFLGGSRSSVGF